MAAARDPASKHRQAAPPRSRPRDMSLSVVGRQGLALLEKHNRTRCSTTGTQRAQTVTETVQTTDPCWPSLPPTANDPSLRATDLARGRGSSPGAADLRR